MDKVLSNKKIIAHYVLPSLLLIMAIVYLPILLTAYYGLIEWNGIGKMKFIGLENYVVFLKDLKFWESAGHSSDHLKTLTVGIQNFIGQYTTDWGAIGATLMISIMPIMIMFLFLSDRIIEGMPRVRLKADERIELD
ncbi:hypothetical protein PMSM_10240 [Paenibacillus macquariensis subsp. macquariensis]|uniref:Sugar ABC transporter permease n=1 Tax=Paenibacillus macquariensis TaxID=948756 RepID=A0ABY1K5J9_9BACL|nr:hypothetical protein PMSM_10240 [Paenibacillus macquariensis subsp. macquariensis]SIR29490.1 hypothetical protein SAMN05421578_11079 [Paenibacillus macquariensis]